MLKQIKQMAKLELCNIFGLNVFRFSKDPQAKRKAVLMIALWAFLLVMLSFYVGGLSYGLILLGAGYVVPAYLIAISSLVIFFFGIFKAGSVIFSRNGYDILCSLPISQTAIVTGRFLRMYVENLALTLAVLLPGLAVYAWLQKPSVFFFLTAGIGALFVPLAPIAAAALIGALVTAVSSRMKHKSLVEAGLSILIVLAVLAGTSRLSSMQGSITPEMLNTLSATVFTLVEKLYPPAVLLGMAMVNGSFSGLAVYIGLSLAIFSVMLTAVSLRFHSICRRLYSTSAKHDYRMEHLKKNSVLLALYKREMKRYFSSGVYVSNTIIGPVMGTILSGALFFVGIDRVMQVLPAAVPIRGLIPFALAGVFCMMTTTSTAISMEGQTFWIIKSLPLKTKTILDAKLLLNLSLMLPFYVVSEILLMLALKPGISEMMWMLILPAVIIVFSCVYGITVNLHLPVLNWESEVTVVKQSASSMLGGMGGFVVALLCAIPAALLPVHYSNWGNLMVCVLLLALTALMYQKNNRTNLQEI